MKKTNKIILFLPLILLAGCKSNGSSSQETTQIPQSSETTSQTTQIVSTTSQTPSSPTSITSSKTSVDPFDDIIEWKEDVTLQVPNGSTWYRKRKLVGGETYYMRRHSGSQSFKISAQYPDETYIDGYNEKSISAITTSSWSFCIAKTSWIKFTIKNENTSTGQTSIYWYDY